MYPGRPPTIVLVEDNLDVVEMLQALFAADGYTVLAAGSGEQALPLIDHEVPDLVVLDIRLPGIDGFEVCARLQQSHRTRALPIIFLTERSERIDRLRGLGMGVYDYITKPFDLHELRLRVRNILLRTTLAAPTSAVTGLPHGRAVVEALQQMLDGRPEWGILAVYLDGWGTFSEQYGFVAGDEVLRVVSEALAHAAAEVSGGKGFCGHLDEHTFVLTVDANSLDALVAYVAGNIGSMLEYFYPAHDRGEQAMTPDRLRLSYLAVTAADRVFGSAAELIQWLLAARHESSVS